MGYYTNFKLQVCPALPDDAAFDEQFEAQTGYQFDDTFDSSREAYLNSVKWYDHEKDMKKLSKEYPEHLFQLDGEGEEDGDIWRRYFKNGKMQDAEATVVYQPFDESKLS